VLRAQRPVNHEYITRENAGTNHGLAVHSNKKGSSRMLDAQFIQIESFLNVILCGRGKTS
jgi:hypothetical protein